MPTVTPTPTPTYVPRWKPTLTLRTDDPIEAIRMFFNFAILGVIITSVAMLIYHGFMFAISGGKQEKVDEAKKGIMYALLGIAIAVSSYVIVSLVLKLLTGKSLEEVFFFI